MKIEFSVENFDCKPAPRPRLGKYGAYLPKEYQADKEFIRAAAASAMVGKNPLAGSVAADIIFRRKFKPSSRRFGDADNLLKTVLDSCNGVIYVDDAQVISVRACKVQSEIAGVDVTFSEIADSE